MTDCIVKMEFDTRAAVSLTSERDAAVNNLVKRAVRADVLLQACANENLEKCKRVKVS